MMYWINMMSSLLAVFNFFFYIALCPCEIFPLSEELIIMKRSFIGAWMNLIINFYSFWIYFVWKVLCKTKFGAWLCKAKQRSTWQQLHPYLQTHTQNLQTHCIHISRHLINTIRLMIKAYLYKRDRGERPIARFPVYLRDGETIHSTIKTSNFDLRDIFHVLLMTYAKKNKKKRRKII